MKILIIVFGSIGQRHYKILRNIDKHFEIFIYSSSKNKSINRVYDLNDDTIKKFDYILICNETYLHFKTLNKIYYNNSKTKIFIEKPLGNLEINTKLKYKNVFIGYNLRFHPVIQYIKNNIDINKILNINIRCMSDLRNWRSKDYRKSYSASKKLGGGVHFDLSHEIDYLIWLFGKPIKQSIFKKKLSNLNIDSIDTYNISGILKNKKFFNLHLNYYSKKNIREIIIISNHELFICDLNKYEIQIFSNKNNKKLKFKKNINTTYHNQHIDILYATNKISCNFREAAYTTNLLIK